MNVPCVLDIALLYTGLKKIFHTFHMWFKCCASTAVRNMRQSLKLNTEHLIVAYVLKYSMYCTVRAQWFTVGSRIYVTNTVIKPVLTSMPFARRASWGCDCASLSPFPCRWPLNLSRKPCAIQERQRVTSFRSTANRIMDSVCAFAIFRKCQQRR